MKQQLTEVEARADELDQNLKSKQMEIDKLEGTSGHRMINLIKYWLY